MTWRIWIGSTYLLRIADTEDAALKTLRRRQRALVTRVERVRTSTEWRAQS